MRCSIPDIRLASYSVKDSVIYTTTSDSRVWYKSCGVTKLPSEYEPTYILTGDENQLNFYNHIISTIIVLKEQNRNFKSISLLREVFCKEYKKINSLEVDLSEIEEMFNYAFNQACDMDIICGRPWQEIYFASFRDIDYVGLEKYMEMAQHYAKVILQKNKSIDDEVYTKKLKI